MTPTAAELLRRHLLRSTPARRAVVAHLRARDSAATAAELERVVDADRVTTYRTLRAFEERGLVHRIRDAGAAGDRFALCGTACGPQGHAHAHAHFHCADCDQTFCLAEASAPVPPVLPEGYTFDDAQLTYRGRCAGCNTTLPAA